MSSVYYVQNEILYGVFCFNIWKRPANWRHAPSCSVLKRQRDEVCVQRGGRETARHLPDCSP